jgi:hypothetical protein
MDEAIKTIIAENTLTTYQVALISAIVSILTFLITNWLKNYYANKLVQRNLETEHQFEQQKKIKEVLAKHKVHLINSCEELNHRMWNFANKHQENWLKVDNDYENIHYYFHSFTYRFLSLFAWIKIIQKDMIYLDTTIASKDDLEFIKFINLFPRLFCDLTFLEGINANGNDTDDHFFRNTFDLLADVLISENKIKPYSDYINEVPANTEKLNRLFSFFDGLSPLEDRKRWDRLQFLHFSLIIFLNNYGYDFQASDNEKIKKVLTHPKKSENIEKYFCLFSEYHLNENSKIINFKKMFKEINTATTANTV